MPEEGYDSFTLRELAALAQPQSTADDLDGVTRETLVEAEIAKHKETLAPDPSAGLLPALEALTNVQERTFAELVNIRFAIQELIRELRNAPTEGL